MTIDCVDCLDQDLLRHFVKRLHKWSSMTWQQVQDAPREGLGHEKIPIRQLKSGVSIQVSPDVEEVLSFRIDGSIRMLGLRQGEQLNVLYVGHHPY